MFLRLYQSPHISEDMGALGHAYKYIKNALKNLNSLKHKGDGCAFLCGRAGIHAVAAVISSKIRSTDDLKSNISAYRIGLQECKAINFSKYGCDEVLVGRAGYLSGIYWLNEQLHPKPFEASEISEVCQTIVNSGRQYSAVNRSPIPLMYQYHGTEYLGAAHGICAIYQMLLESPWFESTTTNHQGLQAFPHITATKLSDIRNSIDILLGKCTIQFVLTLIGLRNLFFADLQLPDGNFPCAMEDVAHVGHDHKLVHWCHGAPGVIYVMAKSYLVFREEKYLAACKRAADLVWQKGLLKKGPGICHGVSGNGYVFLLMYRLTGNLKYLHRAHCFADYLTASEFVENARTPDRWDSLYEGLAGTVCYLIDLLEPNTARFPFMNIFSS